MVGAATVDAAVRVLKSHGDNSLLLIGSANDAQAVIAGVKEANFTLGRKNFVTFEPKGGDIMSSPSAQLASFLQRNSNSHSVPVVDVNALVAPGDGAVTMGMDEVASMIGSQIRGQDQLIAIADADAATKLLGNGSISRRMTAIDAVTGAVTEPANSFW